MTFNGKMTKSSKRIRDLGEVFTPDFLVERMLDQFPFDAWEPNKNWLEPTCGNGQFILGILQRKLSHGHQLLRALNTTFGCDIMPDNVSECHIRIYKEVVLPYAKEKSIYGERWKKLKWQVAVLVENNIRPTKDALKEDFEKWVYFANRPQNHQEKMTSKIQSILHLIDEDLLLRSNSSIDKRLFTELSALKRI